MFKNYIFIDIFIIKNKAKKLYTSIQVIRFFTNVQNDKLFLQFHYNYSNQTRKLLIVNSQPIEEYKTKIFYHKEKTAILVT